MSTPTYTNRYLPSTSLTKPSVSSNYYASQYQHDVSRQSNPTTNNNSIHYYGADSSKNPLTSNISTRPVPIKAYTSSTNPTFNMPLINSSKKPSDSSSNYPPIQASTKGGYTDILSRDYSKRTVPPPSVKPQRGLSIDKANSNKLYQDSSPGGLLGGQASVLERENPRYERYGTDLRLQAAERKLLGIGAQIKPQAMLSSSSRNYGGYTSPDNIFEGDDHNVYGRGNRAIAEGMSFSSSMNKYGADREAEREPAGILQRNHSGVKDRTLKEVYQPASKIAETSIPAAAEQKTFENQNRKITSNTNIRQALYTTSDYSAPAANLSSSENNKGSSLAQTYKPESITADYRATTMKSTTTTSSSEPKGLVGLKNIGNTCFMNSILQSLFNTAPLAEYFSKGTYSKDLNMKNEKGIAKAYADILCKIRAHTGAPSYAAESTFSLKRRIEESNSMFAGYDQHDAQEFLKALLEGINEDLNRITIKQSYKELKAEPSRPLQAISNEWYEYMLGRDNSIVTDLFSGQLLSRTTCTTCGFVSLAFDNYWDLSLSFTRGLSILNKCDLKRMLEHFLKEENLDDLFHCEKCKTKKKFKKGFVIWRLPQVLVIHLKRFHFGKYKKEKITQSVKFPVKNLDLSEFVKESQDPSAKDPTYSLFAVVNHSGSLNGGHYTADCMNPNNRKWYTFNDSSVRESYAIKDKDTDAEGDSPYILFYIKNSCL